MDRRLIEIGQKGLNWAKKKVEEKDRRKSTQQAAVPSPHATASLYYLHALAESVDRTTRTCVLQGKKSSLSFTFQSSCHSDRSVMDHPCGGTIGTSLWVCIDATLIKISSDVHKMPPRALEMTSTVCLPTPISVHIRASWTVDDPLNFRHLLS